MKHKFITAIISAIFIPFAEAYTMGYNYEIRNYSVKDYHAGLQNWDLLLDSEEGIVYVANDGGLLCFNGNNWNFYSLPNKETIHAAYKDGNRIFTAGNNNIGYWEKDSTNRLQYKSLFGKLPNKESKDDNYWSIAGDGKYIYFQSFSRILQFDGDKFKEISNSCHMLLQKIDDEIFTQRLMAGIFSLKDGVFKCLIPDGQIAGEELKAACRMPDGSILFMMNSGTAFKLHAGRSEVTCIRDFADQISPNTVDDAIIHDGKHLLIGTINGGVYVFTPDGKLISGISNKQGLIGNCVHRIRAYADRIWMTLDNGIAQLLLNPDIRLWKSNNEIGRFFDAIRMDGHIFIGTNQGLYATTGIEQGNIDPTPLLSEETTSIQVFKGQMLCTTYEGCYELISDRKPRLISPAKGISNPCYIAENGEEYLVAPSYTFITYYKYSNGWAIHSQLTNLMNSFSQVVPETLRLLWAVHPQKGIYKIRVSQDLQAAEAVSRFNNEAGLEQYRKVSIHKIDGKVFFFSPDGVFNYDASSSKFKRNEKLSADLQAAHGAHSVTHARGNEFWVCTDTEIFLYRITDQMAKLITRISFVEHGLTPLPEHIKVSYIGDSCYMLPTEEGTALIDISHIYEEETSPGALHIETVSFEDNGNIRHLAAAKEFNIPASATGITIAVAKSAFSSSLIRYKLATGKNAGWSEWTHDGIMTFQKLPTGNYRLVVEDYSGKQIEVLLSIYPPFYLTSLAITIYILTITLSLFFIIRKRYLAKKEKLIRQHRIEQKIKDDEIVRLTNEQLKTTINQQRNEINDKLRAISQKQELLLTIDKELDLQKKELGDRYPKKMYERIKKIVSEGMSSEKDFLLFQNYYQEINHDFMLRLKETHSDLSPQDLKFCCLIRSNLSTKDIASILNITVKSVELKRYRIKKKLAIEGGLSDYILSL